MPSHAALSVCAVAQLGEFKILALSRLAAQHEEIGRLRAGHIAAARASGTVLDLPVGRTSRRAGPRIGLGDRCWPVHRLRVASAR